MNDNDLSRDILIERSAMLIDVITMMDKWQYMPSDRISKWKSKLNAEDMVYLKDLMTTSMSSLESAKNTFSFKLYDTLRCIRSSVTQIRVQVATPESELMGNIPFRSLEGYYIDCGYLFEERKAFVKVESEQMNEKRQIIYLMKCGRLAFHNIECAKKGWAWMQCKAKGLKVSNKDEWMYWNGKSKRNDPIKLKINALHR